MTRSLLTHHLTTAAASLLLLGVMAVVFYFMLNEGEERAYHGVVAGQIHEVAKEIGGQLQNEQKQLQSIAQRPTVVTALTRGRLQDRDRIVSELQAQFGRGSVVYLLTVDDKQKPLAASGLPKPCHDFVRSRADADSPVISEHHQTRLASDHYDLTAPVKNHRGPLSVICW